MTVALALVAAASWGTADFLAGLAGRRLSGGPATVLTVPTSAQVIGLVAALGLLAMLREPIPALGSSVAALGAGVANAVGVAALYRGLATGQMTIVAPVAALVTGVTPVVLGLLAGERPTAVAGIGIILAVVAGVLVSRTEADSKPRRSAKRRSILLGVAAGMGLAAMLVLLDRTETAAVAWTVVLVKLAGLATLAAATAVVAMARTRPTRVAAVDFRWEVTAVGVLDAGAIVAYQWAATRGLLAVVAVVASLYPVVTVLLARGVLDERLNAPQVAGVLMAATAVSLIVVG